MIYEVDDKFDIINLYNHPNRNEISCWLITTLIVKQYEKCFLLIKNVILEFDINKSLFLEFHELWKCLYYEQLVGFQLTYSWWYKDRSLHYLILPEVFLLDKINQL